MEKNIVLSISLLASNRLDTIPRCLDSLKPIIKAIPCELVIVDTSGNEEVHSLLKTYTEKVVKFNWCNDFSKARNTGLELCQGEWFMFIDDDEWFVEPEALIEFFTSGEYKKYGAADYKVRNFVDKGKHYHETWVSRLVKLGKDTKFHSKVHEYLAPYEGDVKAVDALVYHSGYIYNTPDEKEAHFQRNISLLYKMEEEEPENLRWKIQIINEYRSADKWKEAKEYGEKALKYLTTGTHKVNRLSLMEIILGYLSALQKLEEYDTTIQISSYARGLLHNMPMSKAYLDLFSAMASFHLRKYDEAEQYIKAYWDGYEKYKKNAEVGSDEERNLIITEAFLKTKRNAMKLTEELIGLIKSEDMDFDTWRDKLVSLMSEVSMDVVDTLKKHLEESELSQDVRFGYFMIIYAEQKLCRGVEDEFTKADYEEWFSTFSIYTQKTYEAMYGDVLNQVEVEALPKNYQAAMWLQLYSEEIGTDLSSAFACIRKLVEVYPMFAEPVKCYLSMMKNSLS